MGVRCLISSIAHLHISKGGKLCIDLFVGATSIRKLFLQGAFCEDNHCITLARLLVDDIVLKNYLTSLTDFEIIPLDESLKQISDIRFFKISEMVYQSNEYSTYKFASVFNSLQNLNCGIFIIADSNGEKTE